MLFSRKRRNLCLRRFLHACVEFGIGATYVYGQRFKAAREKSLAAMRRAKMIVLPRRTLFYAALRRCIFCGNYVSCHGFCKMGKHSSLDVCWRSTFSLQRLMLASAVQHSSRVLYSLFPRRRFTQTGWIFNTGSRSSTPIRCMKSVVVAMISVSARGHSITSAAICEDWTTGRLV